MELNGMRKGNRGTRYCSALCRFGGQNGHQIAIGFDALSSGGGYMSPNPNHARRANGQRNV